MKTDAWIERIVITGMQWKPENATLRLHSGDNEDIVIVSRQCQRRSLVLVPQFFVRSSLLWTPALRPYSGPVRLPRERKGIGRCVRCVLATCEEGRLSRSEQLIRYFYSAPLLYVAYCLA